MSIKIRNELRGEMRRVLANLDERWIQAASHHLCARLSQLIEKRTSRKIESILAWSSFFPGEVDLSSFISEQLEKRDVYLPRVLEDRTMTFVSIGRDWTSEGTGFSHIESATGFSGRPFDPKQSSSAAVITPGLAFDLHGNRLGRGKGYYDRFFSRPHMMDTLKIGVCWSLQMVREIPVRSHDVSMDWICHEEGIVDVGIKFEEDS